MLYLIYVALRFDTNTQIFLTYSFGTQIQPEYAPLHNKYMVQSEERLKL